MTKIDPNAYRKALENRQSELESGSRDREALAVQTLPDELDRIQHATERDMAIGNLDRDSICLLEVRAALRRMDEGTFGICAECEAGINPKRLAAIPWASYCIVCQEAADQWPKTPWNEVDPSLATAA
jgi:DnaK suppressor protein